MPVGEFERSAPPEASAGPLHHALAEPQRQRLIAALREAGTTLDIEQLTEVVGLHPNTVRWHLRVLQDAGIVEVRPLVSADGRRGRRRLGFTLLPQASQQDEYRLLASMLAGSLSGAADGRAMALQAGRSWGGRLVDQIPPGLEDGTVESLDRLVRLLARHGFKPELTPDGIAMHGCPYLELALEHGAVVCAAHEGIVEAALSRLRVPLRVADLIPLARPGTCVLRLEPIPGD